MASEPPPMNPLWAEEEEVEDEDLFKSAMSGSSLVSAPASAPPLRDPQPDDEDSSGYHTVEPMERSDTLEDVHLQPDSPGQPSGIEPEPVKPTASLTSDLAEIRLSDHPDQRGSRTTSQDRDTFEDEEEENPFHDAHLNLSGATSEHNGQNGTNISDSHNGASLSAEGISGLNGGQSSVMESLDREELEGGDDFIHVKVIQPHKVGEGISSYMVYKVDTKTSFNFFKNKDMSVNRRFSDFLGLHDKLSEKYLQNGRIIPPAPDKSVLGMTKLKMSAKEMGAGDELINATQQIPDEFVERRRAALERYLNRTVAHPSLRTDPDLREFLENQSDLPKSNQTSTLSGKNVMRFISRSVDKVTNMTLKMEETDEWFQEKNHSIEQLDHELRRLHAATESLFEYRRSLAFHTGILAKSLSVLSTLEENTELSGALAQLSGVQEKVEHVHSEQAVADFYLLAELIKDYIGLVGAVKDVFQERIKAWQHWQTATATLTKKRESKAKAELQSRQDRVSVLRQEIVDQERQQDMAQENFDKISRLIKKEVEMFDVKKAQDFKTGIIAYLEAMLRAQDDISKHWEQYLPEIKHISHN